MPAADLTFGQLLNIVVGLKDKTTVVETAFNNILKPIESAIASTKNPTLCVAWDNLMKQLTQAYTWLNTEAAVISGLGSKIGLLGSVFGGITLTGSGKIVDLFDELEAGVQSLEKRAQEPEQQAVIFANEVVAAASSVVSEFPALGDVKVAGVSINTYISEAKSLLSMLPQAPVAAPA